MSRLLGQDFTDRVERDQARAEADELGAYRLTKGEFDAGFQIDASGCTVLSADGVEWVCAYGFIDPTVMAGMVNACDQARRVEHSVCEPGDVEHCWAVCPQDPHSEGWFIQWGDEFTAATRNAFPISVVTRG